MPCTVSVDPDGKGYLEAILGTENSNENGMLKIYLEYICLGLQYLQHGQKHFFRLLKTIRMRVHFP